MIEVALLLAFTSGLFSFLAPCVIPLLPAYISVVTGISLENLASNSDPKKYFPKIISSSLLYISGFSLVFVLLGLGASGLGRILVANRTLLTQAGGVLVILFGLVTLGIFNRLGITQRELAIVLPKRVRKAKFLGPFLLGTTFAFAWTPCVGPILGAILTLAATTQNVSSGALLLLSYSLGISLPFFLIALTLGSSYKLLIRLSPKLHYLTTISGIVLVLVGLLMVSDRFSLLTGFLINKFYQFPIYQGFLDKL